MRLNAQQPPSINLLGCIPLKVSLPVLGGSTMTSVSSKPQTSVTSSTASISNSQTASSTSSQMSPVHEAQQDLWKAIQTLVSLQNQAPPLKPVDDGKVLPLSFTQERLWLMNQLEPESSAYNLPFAFRLNGKLDIELLERTLHALLQRHSVLRTTFQSTKEGNVQITGLADKFALSLVNLESCADVELEAQLRQQMRVAAQSPFDLNHEFPLRVTLFRISETDHVLFLNIHHIAFDGWSEGILWKELATVYEALGNDKASPLVSLPVQYDDFSAWQRTWLQGKFLEALQEYWHSTLSDKKLELHLPIDKSYPTVPSRQSASETFNISSELTSSLKAFSRQQGITLFVCLLSAFQVLLHHYTAQNNVFVCSPVANRNRQEIRGLIGYFVNLLVLHANCSNDPSFCSFLTQVRQIVAGAYAHQDLPIQKVISQLDVAQADFSQVMFVLQNTPQQALSLPGLSVESIPIDNGMADFDLSMSLTEQNGGLHGVLKYNQDIFEQVTIVRLLEHFQHILTACIENPEAPISKLIQFTETESDCLKQARCRSITSNRAAQNHSSHAQTFVAPRNNVERQLLDIWETVLEVKKISITDNFFDLGGKSLIAFNLFAQIEERLGCKLPLTTLLTAPTIEQLVSVLHQKRWATQYASLVPLRSQGSKLPLFLVAPGAYTALHYLDLVNLLDSEQPVYGLQSRGLEEDQEPHYSIEAMAAHYLEEILQLNFEGPYLLGGRCGLGASVAFEMAQQLQQQGKQVNLVAFIDPTWNAFRRFFKTAPTQKSIGHYLRRLRYKLSKGLEKYLRSTAKKSTRAVVAESKLNVTSMTSYDQRIQFIERIHKRAMQNYLPQVYPGKIILFQAEDRFTMTEYDRWEALAKQGLERHSITGKHQHMLQEPNIQVLAQKLQICLDRANS